MKATVLHIIESLVVGGAEVLFTESLKGFTEEYRHVVVYMRPPETLLPQVKAAKVYCLGYKGKYNLLSCAFRLRKIVKEEQVELIHAHHYWPAIVARLAKPAGVQLITTVHSLLSQDAFLPNRLSLYLERLTYKQSQHMIFVSEAVAEDYKQFINVGSRYSILHNFIKDEFNLPVNSKSGISDSRAFKLVAVGSLRAAKNYDYLLQTFEHLRHEEIYLDIIGDGPLFSELKAFIKEKNLNKVSLKGGCNNVHEVLNQYDGFILSSVYEGLSLAIIEAMAVGLPCVLSDIAPNREVTGGNALFFDLGKPEDCAAKVKELRDNLSLREKLSVAGKARTQAFQKDIYLTKLEALYKYYLS
ncbi:glycosyltransferase [Pontibacter sp. KCTC 32443]|uniref:glycosyltransferase n=1 Tax=Pontibacter TaxID=323449 RepID=UPI00164D2485|nr:MULTISPECIES: glycosyltransferase [Pontibacter]MBC5775457.1 glycosyltransferase [Pontibacter sp. KCTC 32443]